MALLLDYLAEGSLFYWKHDTAMPARIIGTLSTSNSFRHAFRSLGPTLFPSLSIGRGSVTYDASEVPPSILSHILGFLSDDKVALRACSLACQRWRRAAQPILFRNVRICDEASLIRVANVFDVVPKAEMWISEILLGGGAQRPTCPAWLSLLSSQLLNVYSTITFIQFRNIDPSLEPAFIVSLANFTNVHRLEFDGCTLGEEALWAIICAFPNLRHLTIRNFRRLEAGGQYHYMPYSNDPHALQAKGPLTGLPFLYPPRLQSLEVTHDNKEGLSAHYQLHSTLYRLARSGTTDTLHSMTWLTNEHLDLAKMETWSLNTFMYSLTNLKYVNMSRLWCSRSSAAERTGRIEPIDDPHLPLV
ncbi:hypothetical protein BXZ70DRAFT_493634 [Cristinia sonorae]|uniref:F-box domain-containing protein n=1 Tax=Cristinia sonorae TaxID=1940300 RepID=A0A8K0XM37_9AGAR|nr:hypothetical protein BXZ70DRAFT_493634 [Cristinia sonorae]